MFSTFKKNLMMFLMCAGLVLYAEPALAREGGGGFHGGNGFHGGSGFQQGGGFHGGGGFQGNGFRSDNSRGGNFENPGSRGSNSMQTIGVQSGGFRGMSGDSFNRGFTGSTSNPDPRRGGNFNGGMNSGTSGRSFGSTGSGSRSFANGRGGHNSGEHFGSSGFGGGRFFNHVGDFDHHHNQDFDHHHDHDSDHHHHFFFNPFFNVFFGPSFDSGIFFNPCLSGYVYGYPYYYYNYPGYNYYPYGSGYGTAGNTYYNTYNYYTNPVAPTGQNSAASSSTPAENYFNEGVRLFGNSNYTVAADKFKAAMSFTPQDKVLPFAYAQAVFASGDYISAAAAVREAVAKINPETEGIFYPRGMYASDAALQQQISTLARAVRLDGDNASLQLLFGYNELGMGQLDKAETALKAASADPTNGPAATALLKLVDKLQKAQTETPKTSTPDTQNPATETMPPAAPNSETPVY